MVLENRECTPSWSLLFRESARDRVVEQDRASSEVSPDAPDFMALIHFIVWIEQDRIQIVRSSGIPTTTRKVTKQFGHLQHIIQHNPNLDLDGGPQLQLPFLDRRRLGLHPGGGTRRQ